MKFCDIQIGQLFKLKFKYGNNTIWQKIVPDPPRDTVKYDCQSKNAINIITGEGVFFTDEPKGTEDKFDLIGGNID